MRYSTLFFDLDNTLYTDSSGLWQLIGQRMSLYMSEKMGLPQDQVATLRRQYFDRYGTTLRGLQIHHQVDAEDYLAFVHDLPLEAYLQPQPELRRMLLTLPQRCWIFTNADADHARRVLSILNLTECFRGIIDIRALDFNCKPEPEAYRRALLLAGEIEAQRCVLLDDSLGNLIPARQMGFYTVLVGIDGQPAAEADLSVASLLDLPAALPGLSEAAQWM